MEGNITISVLALILLIIFSAYFSATETAFTSLNRMRIKHLANDGDKKAKLVLDLEENVDKLLTTLLIGNNIVKIAMTAIATVLFVNLYGELGVILSTVGITIVILFFCEISPKSISKEDPEKFSMFSAPLLCVFIFLLTPLNYLFSGWKIFIAKAFKRDYSRGITEDELLSIVEEAETDGSLDEEQSELIQNAIEFNDLEAWDVLTPRVDVEAIEIKQSKQEVGNLFLQTGFSRLPVYEENMDRIVGVLNQKDFHNYVIGQHKEIVDYVTPVVFVAGSIRIANLLKRMQVAKTHIAIVVDEYGGTEGIVTMEDIIEELVGEIWDEHDAVTSQEILQIYDGSFRVLCSTNVEKMFDYFNLKYEEMDVTTVNGWVVVQLDKLPSVGDSFEYENLKVRVTKADGKRALEVNIVVKPKKEEQPEGEKR
ncbi:HlyC/CorC family transporter [Clostridium aminobutyricum]|uniref:HlyC/CorC family transporter n=1 Tax=Clostridium aminobutyricum TaxID=33953 RepID=A0A939IIX2_CLOAM|nr:hemolysin family protein [Clostridium aminobutyricum]MBN7773008.1 HlyC/CorC family transporter [Clostridium aminobutyricum]